MRTCSRSAFSDLWKIQMSTESSCMFLDMVLTQLNKTSTENKPRLKVLDFMALVSGLIVILIWGVPLLLVLEAWRRSQLRCPTGRELLICGAALILLTISLTILSLIGVMLILEASLKKQIWNVAPSLISSINLVLCGASLLCAMYMRKRSDQAITRVGNAIAAAGVYLVFIWFYALLAH